MIQPDVFDLLAEGDEPRKPRRAPCPRCGRFHSAGDTTVSGTRFTRPTAYRATYPGAPSMPTREAAQQDMCDHHRTADTKEHQ